MTTKDKIDRTGYWYIHQPSHPFSGKQGYIAEHRLVMEKSIGRFLERGEVVHHINHDKKDNRIENLELFSSPGQHTKHAHPEVGKKGGMIRGEQVLAQRKRVQCKQCGKEFRLPPSQNKLFCGRKCFGAERRGKRYGTATEFRKGIIPHNKGIKLSAEWILNLRKGKYKEAINRIRNGKLLIKGEAETLTTAQNLKAMVRPISSRRRRN